MNRTPATFFFFDGKDFSSPGNQPSQRCIVVHYGAILATFSADPDLFYRVIVAHELFSPLQVKTGCERALPGYQESRIQLPIYYLEVVYFCQMDAQLIVGCNF